MPNKSERYISSNILKKDIRKKVISFIEIIPTITV